MDQPFEDQGIRSLAFMQASRINELLSKDTVDLDGLGRAVMALKATLNYRIGKKSKDGKESPFSAEWNAMVVEFQAGPKNPDVDEDAWQTVLRTRQFECLMDAASREGIFDIRAPQKNAWSLGGDSNA